MAVTYQEYIIEKLFADSLGASDTDVIKDLIEHDIASEDRQSKLDGIVYYKSKNDKIMDREMTYTVDGVTYTEENRANNKVPSGFHKILVDQKIDYLLGKAPTIVGETDTDAERFDELLPDFHEQLQEIARESSKKSVEAMYVYVDESGALQTTNFAGEDLIFIFDTSHQKELLGVIRYYTMEVVTDAGDKKYRKRVEWYDDEKVTYYMEQDDGNYLLDVEVAQNPQYHWTVINDLDPDRAQVHGFGMVPIIPLWNNSSHMSDLAPIKAQIDLYDIVLSDFGNNIEDIQDAMMVISGYEGSDTSELLRNIKTKKLVLVDADGGMDYKKIDIPIEARDKLKEMLESDIYTFGQGFNPNQVGDGNITNIVIKSRYMLLDLKANRLETQLKSLFRRLMELVNIYLTQAARPAQPPINCEIKFNRSQLFNEAEIAEMAQKSVGVISTETIHENHPWVTDTAEEAERMKGDNPLGDI